MLIDWFTVGAQVLNFIILMGLMKRFLYQPILDAIDARETRIATELADAARKQSEAQTERDTFQKKNEDLDTQRDALLSEAKGAAAAERQRLMDAARTDANALAAKRQESLAIEAKSLVKALELRAQSEVFAIARQTLTDLAGVSLEASACAVFIARLQGLEDEPKSRLAAALSDSDAVIVVRSAFELPSEQRSALTEAIAETLGIRPELRFETEPTLVAGIELSAQGQKFAWTISGYLASLDRGVSELLKAQTVAP